MSLCFPCPQSHGGHHGPRPRPCLNWVGLQPRSRGPRTSSSRSSQPARPLPWEPASCAVVSWTDHTRQTRGGAGTRGACVCQAQRGMVHGHLPVLPCRFFRGFHFVAVTHDPGTILLANFACVPSCFLTRASRTWRPWGWCAHLFAFSRDVCC